ncbi:hypothetical protein BDZ94DRAFT_1324341 [Collybia nuda]|uniref:Uncharacterized protein n=1 Tax=Collybia nuda TaxID=64659 RepID=A0A9P5XYD6_9AGAR|nr:hypothetical protein BDZ94DRAFT_1324341 [Collybia nuda]
MSQIYTFNNERDLFTTTASNTSTLGEYKFSSVFVRPGFPVTTTVTSPEGNEGTIYWKEHAIEVGGVKHVVEDLQQKQSRFKSPHSRRWVLAKNQWQTKYISRTQSWKVSSVQDDRSAPSPAVEFTPYRSKTFGKADPATLLVSVPDGDSIFLVLILIYSHLTELPQPSLLSGFWTLSWLLNGS